MASRLEVGTVYAAGLFQGLALVTFPAASGIFTSSAGYGLSSAQYGSLFLPQAVLAVAAALAGAALARRLSTKTILLGGLVADAVSMALLLLSQTQEGSSTAVPVLMVATAFLGLGFGLTVPALNTFAAAFFPKRVDRAVLILNALLGLGTMLAPVLVAIFTDAGAWWGLPVATLALILATLVVSLLLPLRSDPPARTPGAARVSIPGRFWLFAGVALVYGVVETLNGNWATIDVGSGMGASAAVASLALTAFWGMVTVGRLLFAGVGRWLPERIVYRVLPLVVAGAFLWLSRLSMGDGPWAVVAFGLAGLGCSALLPLTISFGQAELTAISASVAGGLIAAYQIGYGVAAFGVGPLRSAGVDFDAIYLGAVVVALLLGVLALLVTPGARSSGSTASRKDSAHAHP